MDCLYLVVTSLFVHCQCAMALSLTDLAPKPTVRSSCVKIPLGAFLARNLAFVDLAPLLSPTLGSIRGTSYTTRSSVVHGRV